MDNFNVSINNRGLDNLIETMNKKGYEVCGWHDMVTITQDMSISLKLTYKIDGEYKYVTRDCDFSNFYTAFSKWENEILTMRNIEEVRKLQWQQDLADLISRGKVMEMGLEYIAMLEATAKILATNILEAPKN